jgi:glycerol-3-phosphate cytidylyltransferase
MLVPSDHWIFLIIATSGALPPMTCIVREAASRRALLPSRNHEMTTVITFGTFDLFHLGHLRILERARSHGDRLVVGVSSDELNFTKKGKYPVYPTDHRTAIVRAIRFVDDVFVEHSLEEKRAYILHHQADVLLMGDDWSGKFDHLADVCTVVYLPRTEGISSTDVKSHIRSPELTPAWGRPREKSR